MEPDQEKRTINFATIKSHRFFDEIDFESLHLKQLNAPYIPFIDESQRTQFFDPIEPSPGFVTIPAVRKSIDPFIN